MATAGAGTLGLAAIQFLARAGIAPSIARASGTSQYGGTYVFAVPGDWGTIDPLTSVAYGRLIFPRIYNTLVARSARQAGFFLFDLAESLEQPDEQTYVFHIRRGVRIAPNNLGIPDREMDALDAARWLDRITQDPRTSMRRLTDQWLDSYEAPDPQTFSITTRGAYGYFLFRLGSPVGGCIPPREFFERQLELHDQGVGGGPFGMIVPGTFSQTGGIVLQRNPHYYAPGLPYADRIMAVRLPWLSPARDAFLERQIYEYTATDRAEVDDLLSIIPDLQVAEESVNTFSSFVMNLMQPPWNDERIRKAALFALNRQEYVDSIVGQNGGQPDGLVHWPLGDYALPPDELDQLQPYDPATSRQLIHDATGQDTLAINVMYPLNSNIEFHSQHLPIFLRQMSDAGFTITEEPLDFTSWLVRYQAVDYHASLALNQFYDTPEIPLDFHSADGPTRNGQYALGIGSLYPEVEQAIEDARSTLDPQLQVGKVLDAQRTIYGHGPAFLPIMSWIDFTLIHSFVKNPYQMRGLGSTALYLSDWWLAKDAPRAGVLGDASCDGTVNSVDAAVVLQADAGLLSSAPCAYEADVNNDGRIDSIDAALILQYGAALISSLACSQNADVNGDGRTDALDAALVLQYSAGLIPSLGPP